MIDVELQGDLRVIEIEVTKDNFLSMVVVVDTLKNVKIE